MQEIEARRSQRVHYRGTVEVCAGDGEHEHAVRGEALDLGEGGMRISAPLCMPVGSPVTCRVAFDGREAALPGRVAWLAQGERENGIGICFEPLGSEERALLEELLERSRDDARPVELHFAGLEQPIHARGRARSHGVTLTAALPILARGRELSFRLDEGGPLFEGRVGDARLCEERGERRLDVDVELVDRDGGRFRRQTRYGYPDEIEAVEHPSITLTAAPASAAAPASSAGRPTVSIATARTGSPLPPWLVAGAAGAFAGWLAGTLGSAPAQTPPPATAAASAKAAPPAAMTPAAVAPAPPPPAPVPPATTEPAPAAASAAAQNAAPIVTIEGQVTRVLLPFEGNLDAMRSTLWAAPHALAITLPAGRIALPEGRHRLNAAGLGELRLQARGDGQVVRLMLPEPFASHDVALDAGVLEIRLVRATP